MADDGLWSAIGEGFRGMGAVANPKVAQAQAQERSDALPNMIRSLQIKSAQRALDADTKFSESVSGMQPTSFKTSGDVLDALKNVPLDVIAESPRAQQALKIVGTMQQREAAQDAKKQQMTLAYERLDQQRELAEQRSQDQRASAEERARANLANEQIRLQLGKMQEAARRDGLDLQKQLLDLRREQSGGNASLIPPEAEGKTGDDLLKAIPSSLAGIVKKVGDYDLDPRALSTRGGHREKILALAAQYNPQYDDKDYAQIKRSLYDFSTGKQGQTTRSLNVAVEHLDTAKRFADALKNGNVQAINAAANAIATQFGGAAPTSLDAVKEIVADEVVKGVIGGPGALADREQAAKKIRAASSPEQFAAIVGAWTELMGGQLKGLKQQYEGSTRRKDFEEKYLTPRAREAIKSADHSGGAGGKNAAPKNAKGWALMVDAKGNQAYVSPDGKSFEEVK